MSDQVTIDSPSGGFASLPLVKLIRELNVARRNIGSYPQGHPVIATSLARALDGYAAFLGERDRVTLGVAGTVIVLEDQPVEKANPVVVDFARALHERGIGTLTLNRGVTREELRRFAIILGTKRERIYGSGGIGAIWAKAGIVSIGIGEIRYDLFDATEEERLPLTETGRGGGDLWERFVVALKGGGIAGGVAGEGMLDPELVAEALNLQFGRDGSSVPGTLAPMLTEALATGESVAPGSRELTNSRFAGFVAKLNPGIRSQFLGAAWASKAIAAPDMEWIVRQFSNEAILETLEEIGENQQSLPPFVLQLLKQLSLNGSAPDAPLSKFSETDLVSRVRTLFKEHASEQFIPDDYRFKLDRMLEPERIPSFGIEGVHDLMDTLDQASMEKKTGDILFLFLKSGEGEGEDLAAYARNLYDIGIYFLRTGDYPEFLKILREVAGEGVGALVRDELMGLFAGGEFVNEVLDGLETWGKPRFDEIAEVIDTVGVPFVEELLDRLAGSESMSLRRFFMDRLVEIGAPAAPAIVARLSDHRWYFLRNLIALVRRMGLCEAQERLRVAARHRDPRVSQEALKALLEFGDAGAERRVLQDLESRNRETQILALEVAGMSGSPEVLGKLHAMLARPGLSARDFELKSLVVQALGEIGAPASLAPLGKLFASSSFLHPSLLARLKLAAVATLRRYPAAASLALVEKLASKKGELGRQAAQLLRNNTGGTT